jgi:hypothetical protein
VTCIVCGESWSWSRLSPIKGEPAKSHELRSGVLMVLDNARWEPCGLAIGADREGGTTTFICSGCVLKLDRARRAGERQHDAATDWGK